MKDEEIKVGDICEIVGSSCTCKKCLQLVGRECTVLELASPCARVISLGPFTVVTQVLAFKVTVQGEDGTFGYEREYLRKRPPKRDESQWIRQQSTPKADFDKWLDGVRQGDKTPAPAEA